VPHSAEQMFDLVNDVDAYPRFLRWCSGARVVSRTADEMVATVDIGVVGISQSFKTRNKLTPPRRDKAGRIDVRLVAGPFRRLNGAWVFENRPAGGSDVELALDYELSFTPLRAVLGPLFEEIARSQMAAFVARAAEVYGDE
jgi:ribosome-associated toxin RatA of RatAB toxin-antitoxin module